MEAEDFYNDEKDAGEVGAGHSVTALYEVELNGSDGTYHGIDLEFADEHESATAPSEDGSRQELIKFSLAYKDIDTDEEVYSSNLYGMEKYNKKPTQGILLAGAAAEFAMLLKDSEFKGTASYDYIIETAEKIGGKNEKINELRELAEKAAEIQ
jgi:Ca-activated chloride channel family protein